MSDSIDEFKEDVRKGHNGSFHFYSWGIAAANKKRKSDKLEITPTQDFPFTNDEVSSHVKKINSNIIDTSDLNLNYRSECLFLSPPYT